MYNYVCTHYLCEVRGKLGGEKSQTRVWSRLNRSRTLGNGLLVYLVELDLSNVRQVR
jgi:hypothetical protein